MPMAQKNAPGGLGEHEGGKIGASDQEDAAIVFLCQSGHRGALGLMALYMMGWTNVRNLAGGMNAWVAAELPVVK